MLNIPCFSILVLRYSLIINYDCYKCSFHVFMIIIFSFFFVIEKKNKHNAVNYPLIVDNQDTTIELGGGMLSNFLIRIA